MLLAFDVEECLGQHSAHSTALPLHPTYRFRQSARLARYAAAAVNSAVSGLAWVGAKVAGGGECGWPGGWAGGRVKLCSQAPDTLPHTAVLLLTGADKPLKPGEDAGEPRRLCV